MLTFFCNKIDYGLLPNSRLHLPDVSFFVSLCITKTVVTYFLPRKENIVIKYFPMSLCYLFISVLYLIRLKMKKYALVCRGTITHVGKNFVYV